METVTFYTTHCLKCNVLQKKLNNKGIKYDIVDNDAMVAMAAIKHGITYAPFLKVGETVYKFEDAVKWVEEQSNI